MVVDNTNIAAETRARWIALAKKEKVQVSLMSNVYVSALDCLYWSLTDATLLCPTAL